MLTALTNNKTNRLRASLSHLTIRGRIHLIPNLQIIRVITGNINNRWGGHDGHTVGLANGHNRGFIGVLNRNTIHIITGTRMLNTATSEFNTPVAQNVSSRLERSVTGQNLISHLYSIFLLENLPNLQAGTQNL